MPILKGSTDLYQYDITDILSNNIQKWLEYGLLEKGAYTSAKFDGSTSGLTNLKSVYDSRYGYNRIYEGFGPSWVWETDFNVPSGFDIPFQVSGVYVNNTFYSSAATSGTYSHKVDYLNGRIIFNNAIASGLSVKAQYIFRDVDVYLTDSHKWKVIVDEYERRFEDLDDLSPSGMASILKENRVWMPSIIIESTRSGNFGLQLGGGERQNFETNIFVLGDNPFITNRLCDLLNNQFQQNLFLFNSNTVPVTYNINGTLASGALTYPNLSDRSGPYFLTYAYILSSDGGSNGNFDDVYRGIVNWRIEVDRYLSTY